MGTANLTGGEKGWITRPNRGLCLVGVAAAQVVAQGFAHQCLVLLLVPMGLCCCCRWPAHEAEGFQWWAHRMGRALQLYDETRIDHFR